MKHEHHQMLIVPSVSDVFGGFWHRFIVVPIEYLATILAFLILTTGAILVIPIGYFNVWLHPDHPKSAWNHIFRNLIRWYLFAAGVRIEVEGMEYLPTREQPVVFASNHPSHLDGTIFETFIDRRAFAMTMPFQAFPWPFSFWFSQIGCVDVARTDEEEKKYPLANTRREVIEKSIYKITKLHKSLIIFPEGHLEHEKKVLPFKTGAIRIALAAGAPIIPVSIRGTDRVFSPSRWLFRSGVIHLKLHPPFDVRLYVGAKLTKTQLDLLTAQLLCRIAADLPEHKLTPGVEPICIDLLHHPLVPEVKNSRLKKISLFPTKKARLDGVCPLKNALKDARPARLFLGNRQQRARKCHDPSCQL